MSPLVFPSSSQGNNYSTPSCLMPLCTMDALPQMPSTWVGGWGEMGLTYLWKSTLVINLSELCPAVPSSPVSEASFFSLYIQAILITHSCKAVYSLKCICSPQTNARGSFAVILDMYKVLKNSTFPAEVERRSPLPSCFDSQTVNKCPSPGLFSVPLFPLCAFCW